MSVLFSLLLVVYFYFSSRSRHTICALVTGVQTCALPISINDAIEYYRLFAAAQAEKRQADPDYVPLNIAAVFSPPADVSADVKQLQEDLPQEQADNRKDPEGKKAALAAILADYNAAFGTNHRIEEFDGYYPDRKSTSELQSLMRISSAVFCLKKNTN